MDRKIGKLTIQAGSATPLTENRISLYPNITSSAASVRLEHTSDDQLIGIEVMDVSGKRVQHYTDLGGDIAKITLVDLHNGIYLIRVSTLRQSSVFKVVKQ
ncbi:MAG: T9SS type A sorting domain-containing protein [Bacteroidia bacterium]|nr:T9SS type A sorting domain-containing protein [Bacteroidia bacterium]